MYAAHLVFPFRRVSRHPLMWQARRGGGYSLIFKSLNELRARVHRGEGENPPSSVFARRHAAAARSYLNLYLGTTSLVLPFRSGRVRSGVEVRRGPYCGRPSRSASSGPERRPRLFKSHSVWLHTRQRHRHIAP